MNRNRLKVLVVSLQGIGDTLLALPAIKQYAEKDSADISMVVSNSGFHSVLRRYEFVEKVYLWDENKSIYLNIINLRNTLRIYSYDIAFATDPNLRRENIILFLCRAKLKRTFYQDEAYWKMLYFLISTRNFRGRGWHDAEANMKLFGLEDVQIKSIDLKPLILEEEKIYAKELLNKNESSFFITLHPGALSAKKAKIWPIEKYKELCNQLIERYNCRIILIGGKEELELRKEISKSLKNNPIVLQKETLLQTIAIMNETHLFLGNDSGPMHIAAALSLPMLILLGCSDYNRTSPLSDNCLLIRKNMTCSPCYNSTRPAPLECKFDFRCILEIGIDEIIPILTEYIDNLLFNTNNKNKYFPEHDFIESFLSLKNGPLLINLR